MFQKLIRTDDRWTLLIARVALGLVMFPHGAQKLLGWYGGGGWSATIENMSGMGLPAFIVALVIIGEFFGALGLIFGFLGRFCAGSIGVIMLGAWFMVHLQHGFFMNWYGQQEGEGYEYHILAVGLALVVTIAGSGKLSIDRMLQKRAA